MTVESAVKLIDDRIERAKKGIEKMEEHRGLISELAIDLTVGMLKKEIIDLEIIRKELA